MGGCPVGFPLTAYRWERFCRHDHDLLHVPHVCRTLWRGFLRSPHEVGNGNGSHITHFRSIVYFFQTLPLINVGLELCFWGLQIFRVRIIMFPRDYCIFLSVFLLEIFIDFLKSILFWPTTIFYTILYTIFSHKYAFRFEFLLGCSCLMNEVGWRHRASRTIRPLRLSVVGMVAI